MNLDIVRIIKFITFLILSFGCRTEKDLTNKKTILYSGYCKHTQTVSSFYLYADGTYYFNAGSFLGNEDYRAGYELKNDTAFIKSDSVLSNYFKGGLLIRTDMIIDLNPDNVHNHRFIFKPSDRY